MDKLQLVHSVNPLKLIDMGFNDHNFVIIAGPCAVENEKDMLLYAQTLIESNISYMRAGIFKPRTSPYDFQGLGIEAFDIIKRVKAKTGIKIVSEIVSLDNLSLYENLVDIIQVGARSMQNFTLLKALGSLNKPILLKRGFGNTIEEWLSSAEYIINSGNPNVILCERGIRTFETSQRNTLDLASVALLKTKIKLPIIVDPSHATGISSIVKPLTLASLVIGANGAMIEFHHTPNESLSDASQAVTIETFKDIITECKKLSFLMNKEIR